MGAAWHVPCRAGWSGRPAAPGGEPGAACLAGARSHFGQAGRAQAAGWGPAWQALRSCSWPLTRSWLCSRACRPGVVAVIWPGALHGAIGKAQVVGDRRPAWAPRSVLSAASVWIVCLAELAVE